MGWKIRNNKTLNSFRVRMELLEAQSLATDVFENKDCASSVKSRAIQNAAL